jgi:hypothetical protein
MDSFLHDVESTELTMQEHVAFGRLSRGLTITHMQHELSMKLGRVSKPVASEESLDAWQRSCRRIWKTTAGGYIG